MLKRMSSFARQQLFLFRRDLTNQLRNPQVTGIRVAASCFLGLFIALVYLDVYRPGAPPAAVIQVNRPMKQAYLFFEER
jgi:hypothetical protein